MPARLARRRIVLFLHVFLGSLDDGERDAGAGPDAGDELVIAHGFQAKMPLRQPVPGQKAGDPLKQLYARPHSDAKAGENFSRRQGKIVRGYLPRQTGNVSPAMETPIAREIRRRMQLLGITSMRKLSADAGLSESAVKEILSGKVKHAPRADTVAKLAKALGCSSSDLTGASDEIAERSVLAQTANIPEIEVSAGAGGGRIAERELTIAEWRFPTEWLRSELRAMPGDLRLITVEGDSMAPTIEPGDKVLVDFGRVAPSPPGLFVLWDGLALVAKRLEYIEGSEPPSIRILSDNVRYQPYERTCDEVRIVGRIRGRWQRL